MLGQMVTTAPCQRCNGMGQVVVSPCSACKGDGRIISQQTYTVDIPAGISTGQTLRLSSRGAVGPRGGGAGDLYVHIRVSEHESYWREDDDIVTTFRISIAQAALGTHMVLPTLDGDEDLVIPAGTQHGREFVLRGRGVTRLNGRGRGNLRVRIGIDVPTSLSETEEELLRRFATERGEEVAPPDKSFFSRIKSAFT
jgi:molecular chaperone DnaJ